jgi:hypothetical protein
MKPHGNSKNFYYTSGNISRYTLENIKKLKLQNVLGSDQTGSITQKVSITYIQRDTSNNLMQLSWRFQKTHCCNIWLKSNKHLLPYSVTNDLIHIKNNLLLSLCHSTSFTEPWKCIFVGLHSFITWSEAFQIRTKMLLHGSHAAVLKLFSYFLP